MKTKKIKNKLLKEQPEKYLAIKEEKIGDHIFYLGDVLLVLDKIENNSVDLIFTSPPYNVGIKYENHYDKLSYIQYLEWLSEVIKKLYHKLKDDGRFVINIPSITAEGEYKPLFVDVINIAHKIGFKIRNDIIWFKHQVSKRTAWGSFKSPSDPYVIQPYEFILVFNKKYKKHKGKKENIDITREEFINFSLAFWNIRPEVRKEIIEACPAPFPEELAYRVLKFYTYKEDLVLDPFGGSGTTNYVAALLERKSIYIDNSLKSFKFALKRVSKVFNSLIKLKCLENKEKDEKMKKYLVKQLNFL
ncbi:MAG: site-specific DNA-methyltransferase [Candidatus Omnitrophica bacterium]|nr:site-specific DNA-methyltransferase [Candidatus Omnitrophota bacterium]